MSAFGETKILSQKLKKSTILYAKDRGMHSTHFNIWSRDMDNYKEGHHHFKGDSTCYGESKARNISQTERQING